MHHLRNPTTNVMVSNMVLISWYKMDCVHPQYGWGVVCLVGTPCLAGSEEKLTGHRCHWGPSKQRRPYLSVCLKTDPRLVSFGFPFTKLQQVASKRTPECVKVRTFVLTRIWACVAFLLDSLSSNLKHAP